MFQPRLAVVALLIVLAAVSRLVNLPWNLAPIGALALYCGVYFRNRLVGLSVPLLAMFASDIGLGLYHQNVSFYAFHQLVPFTYGCFAIYFLLGMTVRQHWNAVDGASAGKGEVQSSSAAAQQSREGGGHRARWTKGLSLAASTVGAGLMFFLITNVATWLLFPTYAKSVVGLLECFWAAVPFYRSTIAGDVVFVALLFGGTTLAQQMVPANVRDRFLQPE